MNRDVGYVSWHVREISTAIFINHALTMAFEHKTTFINGKPLAISSNGESMKK